MMKPGKTITQVYKLTNNGAENEIKVSLVSFKPKDEKGNISLNRTLKQPWLSWFSLQNADFDLPTSFLLPKGQTQELVLKIRAPETAEEKDYYASLIFQIQPSEKFISSNVSKTSGILTTNILLTISKDGKPPKNGQIIEFSTKKLSFFNHKLAIFDSFDTVPFKLRVANTGRALFIPIGSIKIKKNKKQMEFLEILPQNILAFSQRKLFLKGQGNVPTKEISWQPRGLKIGKFQAQVNLLINTNKKLTSQIVFFLFPWKAILGLTIALFLLYSIKKSLN